MKATVQPYNGTSTLFLNDQPVFANCHLIGGLDPKGIAAIQESVRAFAQNNIHIYSIDAVGAEWTTPRTGDSYTFDFSETTPRLQAVLDADPDALFLLRMGFETYGTVGAGLNRPLLHRRSTHSPNPATTVAAPAQPLIWRGRNQASHRSLISTTPLKIHTTRPGLQ